MNNEKDMEYVEQFIRYAKKRGEKDLISYGMVILIAEFIERTKFLIHQHHQETQEQSIHYEKLVELNIQAMQGTIGSLRLEMERTTPTTH